MKQIFVFLGILLLVTGGYAATIISEEIGYSIASQCPNDAPFLAKRKETTMEDGIRNTKIVSGECESCETNKALFIEEGHEQDFEICQNREIFNKRFSVLKNCPEDKPLRNDRKECVDCGELKDVSVEKQEDCDVCGDFRKTISNNEKDFYCVLDKSPSPQKPLMVRQGSVGGWVDLYSCDDVRPLLTKKDDCDLCPNRYWNAEKKKCFLSCSESDQILTRSGCVPRDKKVLEFWYPEECANFPNYVSVGGVCVLEGYFAGYNANGYAVSSDNYGYEYGAYSCLDSTEVITKKMLCDLCPNRQYIDDKCILKDQK